MRTFGDKEMEYLKEVLDSGVLGWNRAGMTRRCQLLTAKAVSLQFNEEDELSEIYSGLL